MKAVIIMDMPEKCFNCPCHFADEPEYWCGVNFEKLELDCDPYRPDWCPLRPLPEKETAISYPDEYDDGYVSGWNECIRVITGE